MARCSQLLVCSSDSPPILPLLLHVCDAQLLVARILAQCSALALSLALSSQACRAYTWKCSILSVQIHAGSSLPATAEDAQVVIDGIVCAVATANTTELTYTTVPRPSNSTLGFTLASASRGHAAVQV